jgi:hypothetical protein
VEASIYILLCFLVGFAVGGYILRFGDCIVQQLIGWGEEADFDVEDRLACMMFYAGSWTLFFLPPLFSGAPLAAALLTAALSVPLFWLGWALIELAFNGLEGGRAALRFAFCEGLRIVLGLRRPRRRDP